MNSSNITNDYKRLADLRASVCEHNTRYYRNADPTITDYEYDQLFRELVRLEQRLGVDNDKNSPTQGLYNSDVLSEKLPKVQHETPLLSIDNGNDAQTLHEFLGRSSREIQQVSSSNDEPLWTIELKYDGLAVSLLYDQGILVRAATRGDYEIGEDITPHVAFVLGIPYRLLNGDMGHRDVRGEIMMPKQAFNRLNKERSDRGEKPFASARNAASGSMSLLDLYELGNRELMFKAYGISDATTPDSIHTQEEAMHYLSSCGFACDKPYTAYKANEVPPLLSSIMIDIRDQLPFDIDGTVIKVNNRAALFQMGLKSRSPNGMFAFKYNTMLEQTVIEDIDIQVGRTGALTPVARLKPIILGGVVVQNATLHNWKEIKRKDIRIGDTVTVCRMGDVIPGVMDVDLTKRPEHSKPYNPPTECPCCADKELDFSDTVPRCTSDLCPDQHIAQLIHSVSRPALNLHGWGEEWITGLYYQNLIRFPSDLFTLTAPDLMRVEGIAKGRADLLLAARKTTEQGITMHKLLIAMGMRHANEGTAKQICHHLKTWDNWMNATYEQLCTIPDIGPIVAKSLISERQRKAPWVNQLLKHVVLIEPKINTALENGPLAGQTWVVTGTLDGMNREQAHSWLNSLGAITSGSVSKKTNGLLYGDEAGSKKTKAEQCHVPMYTLKQLKDHLEQKQSFLQEDDLVEYEAEDDEAENIQELKVSRKLARP